MLREERLKKILNKLEVESRVSSTNLMEEFPHLYLAPETIKKMWMDHQHQSAAINKRLEDDKRKQSKAKATVCVL